MLQISAPTRPNWYKIWRKSTETIDKVSREKRVKEKVAGQDLEPYRVPDPETAPGPETGPDTGLDPDPETGPEEGQRLEEGEKTRDATVMRNRVNPVLAESIVTIAIGATARKDTGIELLLQDMEGKCVLFLLGISEDHWNLPSLIPWQDGTVVALKSINTRMTTLVATFVRKERCSHSLSEVK